ncbi:MAG TPA: hypothetical protein VFA37_05320 [Gaiellaceae bacterium]|nr:hypothetical protein [Gaiellaceae bacterium]
MLRAALRRLVVILAVVLGGTAAISASIGALAGKNVPHALAVGYYLVGAGVLFASLAIGSRGPMRADRDAEEEIRPSPLGILGGMVVRSRNRRSLRKATPEERRESRLTSMGLFVFGLFVVMLGAAIDPSRRAF